MHARSLVRLWISITLIAVACSPGAQAQDAEHPESRPLRVLLLFPSDVLQPSAIYQGEITKSAIREEVRGDVEFYTEGLDALRLPGPDQEVEFVALLKKRYAEQPPNLIVVHGPMKGFIVRQRAALWPQTPIIFAGVPESTVLGSDFPPDIPGTSVTFDVKGTIDLAMRLQPEAKRLVVMSGSSNFDREQVKYAAPLIDSYRNRLDIYYSPQEPLKAMLQRVAHLA